MKELPSVAVPSCILVPHNRAALSLAAAFTHIARRFDLQSPFQAMAMKLLQCRLFATSGIS
jgi:hypothetical protein